MLSTHEVPGVWDTSGNKAEKNACPCGAFVQVGETTHKHVARGFENKPEACVVQMVTVSAFANNIEPNQRLFNKNNFESFPVLVLWLQLDLLITLHLQGKLEVTYNLCLLIVHCVPGLGLSNEHTTLRESTEVHCNQCF